MIGRSTPRDSLDELDGRRNMATVFCYMDRVSRDRRRCRFWLGKPVDLAHTPCRTVSQIGRNWRALVLLMILPQFENASRSYDASAGNVPGTSRPNR
jgi:hypothetical protein